MDSVRRCAGMLKGLCSPNPARLWCERAYFSLLQANDTLLQASCLACFKPLRHYLASWWLLLNPLWILMACPLFVQSRWNFYTCHLLFGLKLDVMRRRQPFSS
eukprot:c10008_g1_i1 orf=348-656(-)